MRLIDVVVGIVTDDQDRVLIQQRSDGPFAGLWEFPGGKRESGEQYEDALVRELAEENGIAVRSSRPLIRIVHEYPDRVVALNTFDVTAYDGRAHGAEGQSVRWVSRRALYDEPMLPADRPLSVAVNLPDRYLVTPPLRDCTPASEALWLQKLSDALRKGVQMVCLRLPGVTESDYERVARLASARCEMAGAELLLHGAASRVTLVRELNVAGLHLPQREAASLSRRPVDSDVLFGVSAHSDDELEHAVSIGADFATLGTVCATRSHPGGRLLGWDGFEKLAQDAGLPVFAIGGVGPSEIERARQSGGQGIAAIRALWFDADSA